MTLPIAAFQDAALVQAARAGAPSAPEVLWARYSVMVRGVLRRSVGPGHDVDDLVQEVFLRLFSDLERLRDPGALRSYLFGIAVHVARSELRRRRIRRWLRLTDDGVVPDTEIEGADPHAREGVARLYEILDQVSDESRLAFVLRHIEGLELTEVAEALGCSLATAKRKIARASDHVFARAASDPLLAEYVRGQEEVEAARD